MAWKVLPLLALLVLGGVAWSIQSIYHEREKRFHHQAEWELQAINQLQTKSVSEWRERRWSDAMALSDDTAYAQAVVRWLASPSESQAQPVLNRLRILQERARYSAVYLVDPQGRLRLSPGEGAQGTLPALEMQALERALSQAQAIPLEPRRDAFFAFPFFGLLAPLFDGMEPVGAVWLVSDVRATLYPLLEYWPTPSKTAESTLVQRSAEAVEFLSPLRHHPHGSQPLHLLPLTQKDNPAVQAAIGERGILYGYDYRGEEVLSMVSTVPDSPWLVVSKVDVAEAFGEMRTREWLALSLPVSLALLLAGLVAAHWQWRARRRERALKMALERNMRWLENGQKAAAIGYFAYEPEREEFLMSDMASQIFGLRPDGQMTRRQWLGTLHRDDREQVVAAHDQSLQQRTALQLQYRIRRANDQQMRWVQVWCEYETDTEPHHLTRMTGTVQDITERKQSEQELSHYRAALEAQVRLDPLTDVANRLALDEAVAREWHRTLRNGTPLSLLMVDVDHFKTYNDQYGHVAGDHTLQQVAQALATSIGREGDLVARYGGEEFAVLLPDTDAPQALALAQRMAQAVRALHIEHLAAPGRHQHVTVSIGGACVHPAPPTACAAQPTALQNALGPLSATEVAHTLFEQADTALYDAKKAGRDQVVFFSPTPSESSPACATMEP